MLNSIILRLVHYVIALSSFVKQWIFRIPTLSFKKTDILSIQTDAREINKLPLHIGMVFLEDDISYYDIANTILWSVAMGISYISVYDMNGILKRNQQPLYDAIEKSKSHHTDSEKSKMDICLHSGMEKTDSSKTSSRVDVFVLSLEDGRQSLVKTARTICRRVSQNQCKSSDITPQTVECLIQDETGYPDPDLIVRFGQVEALFGFMPWQIRLTEILSIPSHIGLDYKTFKSLLVSYGNTNQRFGK